MAEFCPDCWDKIMDTTDASKKFIISRELDFCEACRQYKPVIIRIKRRYLIKELLIEALESYKRT